MGPETVMSHPIVRVVSAEIQRNGRYLLTQRLAKAVMPGLWEFPGGRVAEGETDADALCRALSRRVGLDVSVGPMVLEVTHAYDDYTVVLAVYQCDPGTSNPTAREVQAVKWVAPAAFADHPFPAADEATVRALIGALDA